MSTNNKSCFVTIIIPVYNEEKFIEQCIESVARFIDYSKIDCEVLIYDGCSTDGTVKQISKLSKKFKYISMFDNKERYQSYALNKGIQIAKGDYILRLDAHAVYPKDYLINCISTMTKVNADNVGGVCITTPSDSSFGAKIIQAITTHKFGVGNSGFRTNASEGYVDTVPFGFYKKETFKKYGIFNENLVRAQDYELNARIIKSGGKVYLNPHINMTYFNLSSLIKFFKKQLLVQGPGNVNLWYNAPYSFALRHSITGIFSLFVLSIGFVPLYGINLIYLLYVFILYGIFAIFASIGQSIRYKNYKLIFVLPLSFFMFHFLHGLGILYGILKKTFKPFALCMKKRTKSTVGQNES